MKEEMGTELNKNEKFWKRKAEYRL